MLEHSTAIRVLLCLYSHKLDFKTNRTELARADEGKKRFVMEYWWHGIATVLLLHWVSWDDFSVTTWFRKVKKELHKKMTN